MIGVFDYTVLLTYGSFISAVLGILVSWQQPENPYIAVLFLLLCGLCDAFDGRVARRKKDRTDFEKRYGIQIDSLSDLAAFGVLPVCIGNAMVRACPPVSGAAETSGNGAFVVLPFLLYAVMAVYSLAALIRLAYFNVTEEERQMAEGETDTAEGRKYYTGLPVTTAALIFPAVLLFQYLISRDITPVYFVVMLFTAFCFVSKHRIRKPGLKGISLMVAVGAAEFLFLTLILTGR